jgi:hypothetical protein
VPRSRNSLRTPPSGRHVNSLTSPVRFRKNSVASPSSRGTHFRGGTIIFVSVNLCTATVLEFRNPYSHNFSDPAPSLSSRTRYTAVDQLVDAIVELLERSLRHDARGRNTGGCLPHRERVPAAGGVAAKPARAGQTPPSSLSHRSAASTIADRWPSPRPFPSGRRRVPPATFRGWSPGRTAALQETPRRRAACAA